MTLIRARDLRLAYGGPPLLDGVDLEVDAGERVALVGRNGSGKSSLLSVLAGERAPDAGQVWRPDDFVGGLLPQELPRDISGSISDVVSSGLGALSALLADYLHAIHGMASDADAAAMARLADLEHQIESRGAWEIQRRVTEVLAHLDLDAEQRFESLSGGAQRRVLLARALVKRPTLLFLDEPTNHLDVETIEWLEDDLVGKGRSLVLVTHDRRFLARVATRIVELDRGHLTSYPGRYPRYLEVRRASLEAEERADALFDRKLEQEEAWVRQGIKARRTRNEGRVRALEQMRAERRARRSTLGNARMQISEAKRSGQLVAEAEGVCFGYGGGAPVVRDLNTTILRGDRVGILGKNGSGKTTILKLLLGEVPPVSGRVRLGTQLAVAYYDQMRAALREDASIVENIGDGNDTVEVNGRRRHVIGYLRDFLFSAERAQTPVRALSGGERSRVVLAKLFARPANLLVLDEPTNDLDLETLELLEELLGDFGGTLLLVTHDRAFLDNVVTSTLAIEDGRVVEYPGGYDDWLAQRAPVAPAPPVAAPLREAKAQRPKRGRERVRSFRERQELHGLPPRIVELEAEKKAAYVRFADPEFLRQGADEVGRLKVRLGEIEGELATCYARWEQLERIPES